MYLNTRHRCSELSHAPNTLYCATFHCIASLHCTALSHYNKLPCTVPLYYSKLTMLHCGVQWEICSIECAVCSLQFSVCSVQCAVCRFSQHEFKTRREKKKKTLLMYSLTIYTYRLIHIVKGRSYYQYITKSTFQVLKLSLFPIYIQLFFVHASIISCFLLTCPLTP